LKLSIDLTANFATSLHAVGEMATDKQPTDLSAEQLKRSFTF
jgi:hypothetical protein